MQSAKLKAAICPSILNSDLADLANECRKLIAAGADYLHLDVMDGHFVPNLTFGHPLVECLRKALGNTARLDVHMMVSDPGRWLEPMAGAGIDQFTFHLESFSGAGQEAAVHSLIDRVKASKVRRCGLSIKPETPVEELLKFAHRIDNALIMTVEPGFGGQKFMRDQMAKVRRIREAHPTLDIQVDGGVNVDNVKECAEAGANFIVAGTAIIRAADPPAAIKQMRETVEEALR